MIRPTGRAVLLLGLGLPAALLPTWFGEAQWVTWATVLAATAGLVAVDGWLALRPRALAVRVEPPASLHVGTTGDLALTFQARGRGRTGRVDVRLGHDPLLAEQPADGVVVPVGGASGLTLPLRPERRGTVRLRELWMRWRGPLALVELVRRDALDHDVPVLPDVPAVRAAAIRFQGARHALAGLKAERYAGEGSEFESLRTWVSGDDRRAIDWKASARHADLLCREYRAERNHAVVMAVDCGRLMGEPVDGLPRLDHAINGALLLSWVALRTGDRVGLYAFDDEPRAWVAPQGRVGSMPRLTQATAALDYSHAETNYTRGLLELTQRLTRRSLVVVFSEFEDDVTARLMVDNVAALARRHVVIFLALEDPGLDALERGEPRSLSDVGRAVVASDMRRRRARVLARIRRLGVHVVAVRPDRVSAELVSRYLDVKRRELV